MEQGKQYWGKYRASVVTNVDPQKRGRIKVTIPDVSGSEESGWAMPCIPVAGPGSGAFVLPPVGAGVWVEFEHGDPDYPIWVGGFWGKEGEVPKPANDGKPDKPSVVIRSCGGHHFVISDADGDDGGLLLKAAGGASVRVNDSGITIDNGKGAKISVTDGGISVDDGKGAKVELQGNTVKVNDGALSVM
jgi:uncharacterized protein involved in type VI secretion and phage assembly